MLILIVEDDPLVRGVIASLVESLGHETYCAEDADRALAYLISNEADLVLLDITLPDISGVELLFRFRELLLPVIIVSGMHEQDMLMKIQKELGIMSFLSKPFNEKSLKAALDTVKDPKKRGYRK